MPPWPYRTYVRYKNLASLFQGVNRLGTTVPIWIRRAPAARRRLQNRGSTSRRRAGHATWPPSAGKTPNRKLNSAQLFIDADTDSGRTTPSESMASYSGLISHSLDKRSPSSSTDASGIAAPNTVTSQTSTMTTGLSSYRATSPETGNRLQHSRTPAGKYCDSGSTRI